MVDWRIGTITGRLFPTDGGYCDCWPAAIPGRKEGRATSPYCCWPVPAVIATCDQYSITDRRCGRGELGSYLDIIPRCWCSYPHPSSDVTQCLFPVLPRKVALCWPPHIPDLAGVTVTTLTPWRYGHCWLWPGDWLWGRIVFGWWLTVVILLLCAYSNCNSFPTSLPSAQLLVVFNIVCLLYALPLVTWTLYTCHCTLFIADIVWHVIDLIV